MPEKDRDFLVGDPAQIFHLVRGTSFTRDFQGIFLRITPGAAADHYHGMFFADFFRKIAPCLHHQLRLLVRVEIRAPEKIITCDLETFLKRDGLLHGSLRVRNLMVDAFVAL